MGQIPAAHRRPPFDFQSHNTAAQPDELACGVRKLSLTNLLIPDGRPLASDLRYLVAPIELLRTTMRPPLARAAPDAPDSQFEFLPRREAGASSSAA